MMSVLTAGQWESVAEEPSAGTHAVLRARSMRLAVIDQDTSFVQVLSNRVDALGWHLVIVPKAVPVSALIPMRLNAVVIDLAVPGSLGWDWLKGVCARMPGLGVVVCTGRSTVAERIRALRIGVDAWVTKPLHAEELICVVEAAVRRHRRVRNLEVEPITVGDVLIRPDRFQAYVHGRSLDLTSREFEILLVLAQRDHVHRREDIYERVWGYEMLHGDRSVDVFVRKLRQKLRMASPDWRYIHTHVGVGYRFAAEPVHHDGHLPRPGQLAPSQVV